MGKSIIEVNGLSKRYRLGKIGATRLRDDLERLWERMRGVEERPDERDFWALRDVSFKVEAGEVLGVIGRNGAGKSTLLKLLSRITEPTAGEICLRGRVASLLEVGTGFHGDLTGRENIFLNGAILGMTRSEVRTKLEEIIAFSEIDKFIDTPVKRYSSGMYIRLAFAVAAHLDPEILIVDEVLAVGDQQFQNKCLGKMQDVSRSGRTVLFVSHNMEAIRRLTTKALLLTNGAVSDFGDTPRVARSYLSEAQAHTGRVELPAVEDAALSLVEVGLEASSGQNQSMFDSITGFDIYIELVVTRALPSVELAVRFHDSRGVSVTTTVSSLGLECLSPVTLNVGRYRAVVTVPGEYFMPDTYTLSVAAFQFNREVFANYEHVLTFEIDEAGCPLAKHRDLKSVGVVMNRFPWKMEPAVGA